MPKLYTGADYSYDPPDLNCLKSNHGVRFIVRYASRNPDKNLTKSELDSALSKGINVCVVWQEGKTQMERGYSGGQTDARDADNFIKGLGLSGIPIYFACDQDYEAATSDKKAKINDYCNGTKSIIGLARNGGYGDDTFCKAQFDAGRISWGWQTYAWSEGMWDSRCQLRQVKNDQAVCSGTIDWDEAWAEDYGQWPRPAGVPSGTGIVLSSCVHFHEGKQYIAYINQNGQVCVNGGAISGSNARAGVGIAVHPGTGQKVVCYTNTSGKLCTYTQDAGSNEWRWSDKGWTAK
jgi:hypothetical protein